MILPADWLTALDSLINSASAIEGTFFRSVEIEFATPDDVISGEGTRLNGGRFAPPGTRAVFASLDEETATREATFRKQRLGGRAQIEIKAYPRFTYLIAAELTKCVDFRSAAPSKELTEILRGSLVIDDLLISQAVGQYLTGRNVQGIVFPSVVGPGANLVVFKEVNPPPRIDIANRKDVLKALRRFASRIQR